MHDAAHEPAKHGAAHHPGVGHYAEAFLGLEVGEDQRADAVAHHRGNYEIRRDDKEALFLLEIRDALHEIIPVTGKGIGFFCGRNLRLLQADLRFKRGGDRKRGRVEQEQRREADMFIAPGGDRHHQRRKRVDHAGDGIGLCVVPFADEHGVEAVVGHKVHAVDRADDDAEEEQQCIIEHPALQQEEDDEVQPCREIIQAPDDLRAGKTIQVRPCDGGHDDLGQVVYHHENGIKQRGARIIKDQEAQGKAGDGVAEHRDDRA